MYTYTNHTYIYIHICMFLFLLGNGTKAHHKRTREMFGLVQIQVSSDVEGAQLILIFEVAPLPRKSTRNEATKPHYPSTVSLFCSV